MRKIDIDRQFDDNDLGKKNINCGRNSYVPNYLKRNTLYIYSQLIYINLLNQQTLNHFNRKVSKLLV